MTLSHLLLQPKSSLQIFRLGFLAARTRCCFSLQNLKEEADMEDTGTMAVEPFLNESSANTPTFVSHEKAKHRRLGGLSNLFRKGRDDQIETTKIHEGTKPDEHLSDRHAESRISDFESLSQPNSPFPNEPASDSVLFPIDKCENESYESVETSFLSNKIRPVRNVKHFLSKAANNAAVAPIDKPRSVIFFDEPSEISCEPHRKQDPKNMLDIKELIDFIGVPIFEKFNSTSSCNNKGPVKNDDDILKSRGFEDRIEDKKTSDSEFKTEDFPDAKVSFHTRDKIQGQSKGTRSSGKEAKENRVLVSFMYSLTSEDQIRRHFGSCGEISDVDFRDPGGSLYRSAYISFKTKEGHTKALKKSGSCIGKWTIVVHSANSNENVNIPIPSLIGDPDIPPALVKNPTRTIKIEQLTREISSRHIKEALAFCESNVSGYFFGPSQSVAYVEFEREIGKERALARQSIRVLGRDLVMRRIDAPRTIVVRIFSKPNSVGMVNLLPICKSLGDVRASFPRTNGVVDIHFGFAEWPNMLEILNRLNGLEVEGTRVRAVPAPLYPPDVLLALWHEPEERPRLKATMQGLLRELGEDKLDISELVSLQHVFLDKI